MLGFVVSATGKKQVKQGPTAPTHLSFSSTSVALQVPYRISIKLAGGICSFFTPLFAIVQPGLSLREEKGKAF